MAEWRDVKGYEGLYLVSDDGRVLALPKMKRIRGGGYQPLKSRELKPAGRSKNSKMPGAYPHVNLMKNGVPKTYFVHRLVAEAFIPNPDNLEFVNHKDHDTWNNNVSNLEWCTRQYNNEYSSNKPIDQYTTDGRFVAHYRSIKSAVEQIAGAHFCNIDAALLGRQKTAYGYVWKFSEEVN